MGKRTKAKLAQIGQPRFRVRDAYKLDAVRILGDGAIAAIYGSEVSIFEPDGRLRVFCDAYRKLVDSEKILNPNVAIAPDGSALAYLGGDKLAIWSIAEDRLLRVLPVKAPAWKKQGLGHDVHWTRNGIVALSSELSGGMHQEHRTVFFWSASFEAVIIPVNDESDDVGLAVADDCSHCIVGRQLISLPDGKHVRLLEDHAICFAVSDGARRIVHASSEEIDGEWKPGLCDERGTFVATSERTHIAIALSPDGTIAAARGFEGLSVVDFGTKKERFYRQLGKVEGVSLSKTCVASSTGPRIVIYDVVTGDDRSAFEGVVGAVALSTAGLLLASDREVRVLGDDGVQIGAIASAKVRWMASAGGVLLLVGEGGLRVLDVAGNARFAKEEPTIDSIAIADDGSRVAAGVGEQIAIVWSAKDGSEIARSGTHPAPVEAVAFSKDAARFATASSTSFEHGDMYGDGVKVLVHENGAVIDAFEVDGNRPRMLAFEGDDVLVMTQTRAYRRKNKKTAKLATPVLLRAPNGETLRAKGDGLELCGVSGRKVLALALEGKPVAMDDTRIVTALDDGTFALYSSR